MNPAVNRTAAEQMRPKNLGVLKHRLDLRVPNCYAFRIAAGSLFLFLLAGMFLLAATQLLGLFNLDEIGYGDSYVLYDVQHLQRTGEIYRDSSRPPYLPAQYSPLVYIVYSAVKWNVSGNPFFAPRLAALAAFLLCIVMVLSIVRTLIPGRSARLWGLLLAASIGPMAPWVLQLRGDFLAIFFALATIRLLLSHRPHAAALAGLCAGLATQFKLVYVAALLAGLLWLLLRRKWSDCVIFGAAASVTSVGLYILFWLREPRMLRQMFALSPGIPDLPGCLKLICQALTTPVVLLALPALPLVLARRWPRWMLILLFTLISLSIGGLADIQAGGNLNYFFEGLFALCPLAVLGTLRLLAWCRGNVGLALFLIGLIFCQLLPLQGELYLRRAAIDYRAVAASNHLLRRTAAVLNGLRVFSTVPRLALLDPDPALMEPYLLSYLQRLHKIDMEPILERVRRGEFDVAVTADHDDGWRGVPHIASSLREVITAAYRPYCTLPGNILYLPRTRPANGALVQRLVQIDCEPFPRVPLFP